jgi:hypothetical protein
MVTLVDACSGGDFESKKRIADKGRFMKIVSTIYKLAVSLQRLKIWTDGLGRFIDDECHPNQLRSNQDDDAI